MIGSLTNRSNSNSEPVALWHVLRSWKLVDEAAHESVVTSPSSASAVLHGGLKAEGPKALYFMWQWEPIGALSTYLRVACFSCTLDVEACSRGRWKSARDVAAQM